MKLLERYARAGPLPDVALARALSMRAAIGITRIADITGLDRLGIPVIQAVRPFSLSNAVSQGKGGDATAAAISAILESAEAFFAERIDRFDSVIASAASLQVPLGRFDRHLATDAAADWRDRDTAWVPTTDLLSGVIAMVPFELVHTAYVVPPLWHDGFFTGSTTGLAAAFNETDAIVHALLECIERDAIARAHQVHGFFQRFRIDPGTIEDPVICQLLETLRANGVLIGLWHAPSTTDVPVVWCHLMEDDDAGTALLPHPADGSAAAFDAATAIRHAVYEAAQSRITAISGARDDMTRAIYPKYPDWDRIKGHRRLLAEGPCPVDFERLAGKSIDSSGDGLRLLLSRLADTVGAPVLLMRLDTEPVADLAVVKVLVPELEPLLNG